MSAYETSKYCRTCQRKVRATRPRPNHILHLLLTLLTAGLWLIVWVLASFRLGGWRCPICGLKP